MRTSTTIITTATTTTINKKTEKFYEKVFLFSLKKILVSF